MKKIDNIWAVDKIDKSGKAVMAFKDLNDIKLNDKISLGEYIANNEAEKKQLRKDVSVLKKALAKVIEIAGGLE